MRRFLRLVFIVFTVLRFGLDELAMSGFRQRWVRALSWTVTLGRRFDQPRGVRLRLALERLGPIFVKFGQVLSTRRDLLPLDVADELARLQDRVPPFPRAQAAALVEKAFGRPHRRTVCQLRRRAGGQRVHCAGALRHAEGRPRGRGQGAAPGHAGGDRRRPDAAAHAGALGRTAQHRRQAPEAARGGGRIRQLPARRAGPGARSRQCRAAAPQHARAGPGAGARDDLGLVHTDGDRDGAHERHPDQPDRSVCATPGWTSRSWRATA